MSVPDNADEALGWERKLERMDARIEMQTIINTWRAVLSMARDGCSAVLCGYGDRPSDAVDALWQCYQRMLSEGWVRS